MKSIKTLLFFLMLNFINPLLAANQIVTNNNDSGAGSLRQAISDASIGDEITFNLAAGNETIVLTSSVLFISKSLTIDGSNSLGSGTQIAIDGDDTHRVLEIIGGLVSLKNMTIQNGYSPDGGGGIHNSIYDMWLTINNCQIINNTGGHDYTGGGGICNEGIIDIISNTTFSGNYSGKYGAGIYNRGTIFGISQCTINDNILSSKNGGGLYNDTDGTIYTIDNSTISGNMFADYGGGLYNSGTISQIDFCTIANNQADNGGGIYLDGGSVTIKNSISANNAATFDGDDYYRNSGTLIDNGYNIVENSNTAANAAGGFNNINTILYNTIYNNHLQHHLDKRWNSFKQSKPVAFRYVSR